MSSINFSPRLVLIPVLLLTILGPGSLSQELPPEDLSEESRSVTGRVSIATGHVQTEDHVNLGNGLNTEPQVRLRRSWVRDPNPWTQMGKSMMLAGGSLRGKKECGSPAMARRLFGPVLKRSHAYFATSKEEVEDKIKEEDSATERRKRNDVTEYHSGGGCMAKREWIDMGAEYYPRYVRSYHCSSSTCDRGFGALGECKPKHYTTKVLKRITPVDLSDDNCDHTLPEDLRSDWKFISVTVTTCCDCASPTNFLLRK